METDSYILRRIPKYPTNKLCRKALIREHKYLLTGSLKDKPEFPLFLRLFRKKYKSNFEKVNSKQLAQTIELDKSVYSRWYDGKTFPDDLHICQLDTASPGISSKWLNRGYETNRIQSHLSSLDIKYLHENYSSSQALDEAYKVLVMIYSQWKPGPFEILSIPSSPEREGLNWKMHNLALEGFCNLKPDLRTEVSVGMELGPYSDLSIKANNKTINLYSPTDPLSVIPYMLAYAIQSKLPDPGLKEAFIFDFLTAVTASNILMGHHSPGNTLKCGMPASILNACKRFFWGEDFVASNENMYSRMPISSFEYIFDELGIPIEPDNGDFLKELKTIYFKTLSKSGESTSDLLKMFENTH